MDPSNSGSVEEQLLELREQVQRLEEALERSGILARGAMSTAAPPPRPLDSPSFHQQVSPPHETSVAVIVGPSLPGESDTLTSFTAPAIAPDRSLESRIGSQWFNRIGILAVLIGMAWFLKLAIDNAWIGPLGRILIGLVAGAGLIAWSERFQRKGYTLFAYSLKAVGSGILYLSIWAAYSVYHLIPSTAAFAAMIVVTAFNAYMAWVENAELLAVYAIVGGLTTPLLLSNGENHQVALFSYLALLDLAVLILVMLRPWSRLLFMAFVGTVLFYVGWSLTFVASFESKTTTFFTTCFFVAFALAPRLIRVRNSDPAKQDSAEHGLAMQDSVVVELTPWDTLAALVLPILNAVLGFAAYYFLFNPLLSFDSSWAGAIQAVVFAAFYLCLLRLPARGILRPNPPALANLHLTAAIVFITIAIPLKAQGRWLTIGWLTEGAALLWTGSRLRSQLLSVLALCCLLLGLVMLVFTNPQASSTPLLNQRFATYLIGIAVFALTAWLAQRQIIAQRHALEVGSVSDKPGDMEWAAVGAGAVLLVNALALLALSYEIHNYWWQLRWHSEWSADLVRYNAYSMDAQFTYSALFMLYGAALLAVGFSRNSAFLRWQSLVLIAVAIGKVFVADMSQLSQGYRVVSFLALGILLLGVSFVYQRDWLKLRVSGIAQGSATSKGPGMTDSSGAAGNESASQ